MFEEYDERGCEFDPVIKLKQARVSNLTSKVMPQ
jgi:hypothetical protein